VSLEFDPTDSAAAFGLHFLIGLQKSPRLTEHDRRLLTELRPAGVVLFRDNFDHAAPYEQWLETLAQQLAEVRRCVGRDELLVCIDHEGGAVLRTPAPLTAFAAAARWSGEARRVGAAMGRELRSLGVNVDFAPVADIHLQPDNPIIGQRAFGSDAVTVRKAAVEFLRGLESEGVLGCAKHFPGHGATVSDSHLELPVLETDLDTLRRRELQPFAALVEHGVRLVMTAHILFPRIDPDVPATLSPRLLRGVLRGELGFDGVIVSDDVGMRAVAGRFAAPRAAARALTAGCDLIAICAHLADTGQALAMARDLAAAWRDGSLPEAELAESHGRVSRLLEAAPRHPVEPLPAAVLAAHRAIAPLVEPASG
jgi:beta-N-acetylhexosaminidase